MMTAGNVPASHLAVPTQNNVLIFSATEGSVSESSVSPLATLPAPQTKVSYSKSGQYLAIVFANGAYLPKDSRLVYVREGDEYAPLPVFSGQVPSGSATAVSISPDGVYLAIAGSFGDTYIYKRSGDQFSFLTTLGYGSADSDLQFSSDGSFLIVSIAGSMRLYRRNGDLFTNVETASSTAYLARPVAISSDTVYVAEAPSSQSGGLFFRIFKRTGDFLTQLPASFFTGNLPSARCWDVAFSPLGNFFAAVSDNTLYIYRRNGDNFSAISITQPALGPLRALAFDADGNLYVSGIGTPYLLYYKYNGGNSFTKSSVTFDNIDSTITSIDVFPNATYGE